MAGVDVANLEALMRYIDPEKVGCIREDAKQKELKKHHRHVRDLFPHRHREPGHEQVRKDREMQRQAKKEKAVADRSYGNEQIQRDYHDLADRRRHAATEMEEGVWW